MYISNFNFILLYNIIYTYIYTLSSRVLNYGHVFTCFVRFRQIVCVQNTLRVIILYYDKFGIRGGGVGILILLHKPEHISGKFVIEENFFAVFAFSLSCSLWRKTLKNLFQRPAISRLWIYIVAVYCVSSHEKISMENWIRLIFVIYVYYICWQEF